MTRRYFPILKRLPIICSWPWLSSKIRDAGGSVVVTDLASAIDAIKIIVDQGEGNCGEFDDPDHLEKDYYGTFVGLQEGETTWKTYPVRSNPKTHEYWNEDKRIYHVSETHESPT